MHSIGRAQETAKRFGGRICTRRHLCRLVRRCMRGDEGHGSIATGSRTHTELRPHHGKLEHEHKPMRASSVVDRMQDSGRQMSVASGPGCASLSQAFGSLCIILLEHCSSSQLQGLESIRRQAVSAIARPLFGPRVSGGVRCACRASASDKGWPLSSSPSPTLQHPASSSSIQHTAYSHGSTGISSRSSSGPHPGPSGEPDRADARLWGQQLDAQQVRPIAGSCMLW